MDAAVALLLLALPNLRVAHLNVRFQHSDEPLDTEFTASMLNHLVAMSYQGQTTPPLESVKFYIDRTETTPEALDNVFLDALWLFYFPNIESITARMVERTAVFEWPLDSPICPSLMSLELHSSCMRMNTLGQLLAVTPNLKELVYYHHFSFNTRVMVNGCYVLDCTRLREALEPLAPSLQYLSLSMQYYTDEDVLYLGPEYGDNVTWRMSGTLGNMNNFTKLRYLDAPWIMLLGWSSSTKATLLDILPEQLTDFCCSDDLSCWYLVFIWPNDDVLEQMVSLIQGRSDQSL